MFKMLNWKSKLANLLGGFITITAVSSVESKCLCFYHQPKVPEALKK